MIDMAKLRKTRDAATKGPWRRKTIPGCGFDQVQGDDEFCICDVEFISFAQVGGYSESAKQRRPAPGESEANADLITQARDLADAVLAHPDALRAAMIRGYSIGFATGQKTDKSYWLSLDPARNPALQAALKELGE